MEQAAGRLIADQNRFDIATRRVTEDVVRAVPEPEFTKTWHPINHSRIIDVMAHAVLEKGLQITDRQYSITKDGMDMFGVWKTDQGSNGQGWAIGMRNSMRKRFAVGICAGNHITVCDNMVFAGDFVLFRKHTRGIIPELPDLAIRAVDSVTKKLEVFTGWHLGLKEHNINNDNFKVLTYNAMETGAFAPSRFTKFIECYKEENETTPEVAETLYAFHGAGSRLLREDNLFQVSSRTDSLNQVCDDYIEVLEHPEKGGLLATLRRKLSGVNIF